MTHYSSDPLFSSLSDTLDLNSLSEAPKENVLQGLLNKKQVTLEKAYYRHDVAVTVIRGDMMPYYVVFLGSTLIQSRCMIT